MYRFLFVAIFMIFCTHDSLAAGEELKRLWDEYLHIPDKRESTISINNFLLGDRITKQQREELEFAVTKKEEIIRVATFNILFNIYEDALPLEYRWEKRLPRVIETIHRISPDIIGLQETQKDQAEDLMRFLAQEYIYLSALEPLRQVDTSNNFTDGILFRKDRFELIKECFSYHSQTPTTPSLSEEASFPTVNHHIILKDKRSGEVFGLTSCHLYFFSPEVRSIAIDALSPFMEENPDLPMIFMGDLNLLPPFLDYTAPFADGYHLIRKLRALGLIDSLEESRFGHIGPLSTYTNSIEKPKMPFTGTGIPGFLLDRIFINNRILTLLHGTYSEKIDGYFSSDHFPVVADLLVIHQ